MNLIMCQSFAVYLTLLLCSVHINLVTTELYTAVAEMEELLETEALLINNLDNYISVTQKKLEYLKM
jgi:prolyl 4-hydroxylase